MCVCDLHFGEYVLIIRADRSLFGEHFVLKDADYLYEKQSFREKRHGERGVFSLLVHFWNAAMARAGPGEARSIIWVFSMGAGAQDFELSSAASSAAFAGS